MRFKEALRDGSDPLYAPCIGVSRGITYWKAPKKYRDLGYKPTSVALGKVGETDPKVVAREARKLTVAMLDHFAAPDYPVGTWNWLIHRYETDDYSPFRKVKMNSRKSYREQLAKLKGAIGHLPIAAMTFEEISKMEVMMQRKGRTPGYIRRLMQMMRIVAGYGKALRIKEARDVADTLGEMTFASGPRRNVHPTREQIRAIIDEADCRGLHGFAASILIQWTYMLRAVDVRGHWWPNDGQEGGFVRDGMRWQDGLTWDMVAPDLSSFEKVISKTRKSMPWPMTFELTPELKTRLRMLGVTGRFGPVIRDRKGFPYKQDTFSKTFVRIRDHLKLPKEITMMDTRAGAITEGRQMGADPFALRDAAQHANVATTDRYVRGRSESAAKVVKLRNQ